MVCTVPADSRRVRWIPCSTPAAKGWTKDVGRATNFMPTSIQDMGLDQGCADRAVMASVPLSSSSGHRKRPSLVNGGHSTTDESILNSPEAAVLEALSLRMVWKRR